MKEQIKSLLATKSTRDTVELNTYLKAASGNIQTRERMQDLKKALNELVQSGQIVIVNNNHTHLDSVNSNHDNSGSDGLAQPAKYHNLDTVSIAAYGTNHTVSVVESPKPKQTQLMSAEQLDEVKKRLSGTLVNPKPELNGAAVIEKAPKEDDEVDENPEETTEAE